MFERYAILDESSLTSNDSYIQEELSIYGPTLMISIKGISDIQKEQFYRNIDWIAPMLSKINLFNDRALRCSAKLVTDNQINPILISYSNSLLSKSS